MADVVTPDGPAEVNPLARTRIFVDTETTGLDPDIHELLEVAILRETILPPYNRPGKLTVQWCRKIRPLHPEIFEPEAYAANGYTPEAWADAVPFEDVAAEIVELLMHGTLIGHNPKFDVAFITAALKRVGIKAKLPHRSIDTTTAAYLAWGLDGKLKLSLDNLRTYLGITVKDGHRALKDALDCRQVFYQSLGMTPYGI